MMSCFVYDGLIIPGSTVY